MEVLEDSPGRHPLAQVSYNVRSQTRFVLFDEFSQAPDGSTPRQQEATIAAQAETVEQRVMELKGREHYLAEREKDSVLKEFELSRWEMEVRAREKTLQVQ